MANTHALAQSNSRRPSSVANRDAAAIQNSTGKVAKPKPQGASPFLPTIKRGVHLPLALSGFCVVSLREGQEWVVGAEQNQLVFDGQIYWFTSQRQRAMFAANPQRYVPALGGDCVVSFAEHGTRRRGQPKFGILHDQRLFFFSSSAEQGKFQANPSEYASVDLANKGQCLVSNLELQKQLPGLPETTVIVGGMRYLFAGVDQQQKFLINMRRYGVTKTNTAVSVGLANLARTAPPAVSVPNGLPENKPIAIGNSATVTTTTPKALDEANLIMSGYCPVSIHDEGVWILGDQKYQAEFDGRTFLFAGAVQKASFLQNPFVYIPALGGHCVVTEVDNDRRVRGNIYHAVQYEGRLYLFAAVEQKLAFKASPSSYLGADLVEQGNCIVTLVDEGRRVEGLDQFLIWHQSKRYLFASAEMQAKFREDTQRYQDR